MTKTSPVEWDRHAIKAELGRRGLTLVAVAEQAGLEPSVVRHGLRGGSRRGAEAIARALGVSFRTLFPDSYLRGVADKAKTSRESTARTSQKHHVRGDTARGAA